MSFAPRALARRSLATRPTARLQYRLASPPARSFAKAKEDPSRPEAEAERRRGAPEGPPKDVSGVMRPAVLFILAGAFLSLAGFIALSPSSGTKSGAAVQKRIREGRRELERKEGDREEEETPRMRQLELLEMEDRKREKALKEKGPKEKSSK